MLIWRLAIGDPSRPSRSMMAPADGETVQRSTDGVVSADAAARSLAREPGTGRWVMELLEARSGRPVPF